MIISKHPCFCFTDQEYLINDSCNIQYSQKGCTLSHPPHRHQEDKVPIYEVSKLDGGRAEAKMYK